MYEVVRTPTPHGRLQQGDETVGVVKVPEAAEEFVDEFNREYAAIGLRIELPAERK